MSNLQSDAVDFYHLDELLSLESAKMELVLSDTRGNIEVSTEALANAFKDYALIQETIARLDTRKNISKHDVLALESLRPRYSHLDNFLKENTIAMYTTEASKVMYDVSMENFLIDGAKALWNLLTSLGRWILGFIKKVFAFLTGQVDHAAKVNAKASTHKNLVSFINEVRDMIEPVPELNAKSTKIRSDRHQDLHKAFLGYHVEYINNIKAWDEFVIILAKELIISLDVINIELNSIVESMTKVTTVQEVMNLHQKTDEVMKANRPIEMLIREVSPKMSVLAKRHSGGRGNQWLSISNSTQALYNDLDDLTVHPGNDVKMSINPLFYKNTLDASSFEIPVIDKDVINSLKKDLPRLVRTSNELSSRISKASAKNDDVDQALVTYDMGKVITGYQKRITFLSALATRVEFYLKSRNEVVDKLMSITLTEAKELAKVASSAKDILSVGDTARYEKIHKEVIKAIRSAKL